MNLSVTTVDFLVVLVVLASTGYAVWRGFLWETLTIFAWVAAAFGCLYFGPIVVPFMGSMVSAPWLAGLLGYAAVFLAVLIPFAFMTHRFSQSVKGSPIGPFDRALGAVFGVIRGLVIVGLAYIAFTWFVPVPDQPLWLSRAKTLPIIQSTDEVLLGLVPDRAQPDFAVSPRGRRDLRRRDPVGDLIRREEARETREKPGNSVQHKSAPSPEKRYGARDRQALDKLIESTGNDK
jgi:membrane protein required for colicin V production